MKTNQISVRSMDDFLHEIAMNGMFLDYMICKTESESRLQTEERNIKTYILKDELSGLYKIGKTSDLDKRLKSLRCGNPFISLYATIGRDCESELHKLFDSKRFEREWFNLSDDDIEFIVQTYNALL